MNYPIKIEFKNRLIILHNKKERIGSTVAPEFFFLYSNTRCMHFVSNTRARQMLKYMIKPKKG